MGVAPRLYAHPPARAHLLDAAGEEGHIVWHLHDLSVSGALIDTRGPIPVGTRLSLALSFDDQRVPVEAEVIRVQEPTWETLPGVGVRFLGLEEANRSRIAGHIRSSGVPRR